MRFAYVHGIFYSIAYCDKSKSITGAGLKLYLHSGYSNTVTVFEVPECTTAAAILDGVKKDYNIMLAGSFDVLAGKVIRIGHMGNNATFYNVRDVFHALDGSRISVSEMPCGKVFDGMT